MTLLELAETVEYRFIDLVDWLWPCFGPGQKCLIIGREQQHIATAIVDAATEIVNAVEINHVGWWVNPLYRTAYLETLEQQALMNQGRELAESESLLILSEL
jgi:hypothetical protein